MNGKIARKTKEYYSEEEAAEALGISIERLHQLLDKHIFTDAIPRPARVTFRASDLVLLGFWEKGAAQPKVIRLPVNRVQ